MGQLSEALKVLHLNWTTALIGVALFYLLSIAMGFIIHDRNKKHGIESSLVSDIGSGSLFIVFLVLITVIIAFFVVAVILISRGDWVSALAFAIGDLLMGWMVKGTVKEYFEGGIF